MFFFARLMCDEGGAFLSLAFFLASRIRRRYFHLSTHSIPHRGAVQSDAISGGCFEILPTCPGRDGTFGGEWMLFEVVQPVTVSAAK